jgi:hypothetical protein
MAASSAGGAGPANESESGAAPIEENNGVNGGNENMAAAAKIMA